MDELESEKTEQANCLDKRETLDTALKSQTESNRKELRKSTIFFIIVTSLFTVLFLVFLILLLVQRQDTYKVILVILGVVGLAMSVILYKVVDWRMKHICPSCGEKRSRQAEFIDTTEKLHQFSSQGERWEKVSYTHIVKATYTCPKCGDTYVCIEKQNGGYISESESGQIIDKRREPRL